MPCCAIRTSRGSALSRDNKSMYRGAGLDRRRPACLFGSAVSGRIDSLQPGWADRMSDCGSSASSRASRWPGMSPGEKSYGRSKRVEKAGHTICSYGASQSCCSAGWLTNAQWARSLTPTLMRPRQVSLPTCSMRSTPPRAKGAAEPCGHARGPVDGRARGRATRKVRPSSRSFWRLSWRPGAWRPAWRLAGDRRRGH